MKESSSQNLSIDDRISFDPPQMEYGHQSMSARFFQNCHVRFNEELINEALKYATDKQLREEVRRRAEQKKLLKGQIVRCRDCKHCINGYTTARASWRGETTAVCALKPKYKAGPDCHYSTSHSNRACVNFEPK